MDAKHISGLIAVAVSWGACKKAELPPPAFNDPVFHTTYLVDGGTGQAIYAGQGDVYLFTDHQIIDQQLYCSGSFSKVNCPAGDCPGSLTFEFRSEQTDTFIPDSIFHPGEFEFLELNPLGGDTVLRALFIAFDPDVYDEFIWKINGVDAGSGLFIEAEFPNISVTPKTVELRAYKSSGLNSTISRKISLVNPDTNMFIGLNINILPDSIAQFRLAAEVTGASNDSLLWNTGDTGIFLYQDTLLPSYTVFATDGAGNSASASFSGLTPNEVPVRTANFTYDVQSVFIPVISGEVAIQWIDPEGVRWRSDLNSQPPGTTFQVLESEPYEENEQGQKTRKMRVLFNCLLFNDTGDVRAFEGTGVIAVAHP